MKRLTIIVMLGLWVSFPIYSQWVSQATGFSTPFRGIAHIWAVDENIAWAAAYDGSGTGAVIQEFTRTVDGGSNWIAGTINDAAGLEPSMIFALNADTAWITMHSAVASGGKTLRTSDGGQNWIHQATALWPDSADAYPNLIYFWNANEGFSMGDPSYGYFELYTTLDGGQLWSRVDSSHIPPIISGEYGYEGRFSVLGNTILFGTNKGRLFKSNDRGHTWSVINTPLAATNGRVRVVEFRDTLNGIIADRVNNVYVMHSTDDGGASWQPITPQGIVYGNDLRYIKGTPATYISSGSASALSGASISYDGGLSWTDISMMPNTQYTAIAFPNSITGWAGQFNQSAISGGVAKFVGSTVSVHSYQERVGINIFPNPSQGLYTLQTPDIISLSFIQILDHQGRLVYQRDNIPHGPFTIDIRDLATGVYLLRAMAEEKVYNIRLIKS